MRSEFHVHESLGVIELVRVCGLGLNFQIKERIVIIEKMKERVIRCHSDRKLKSNWILFNAISLKNTIIFPQRKRRLSPLCHNSSLELTNFVDI